MDCSTPQKPTCAPWLKTPRKKRGVYDVEEGCWKCACNPSLVALRRQTQKTGENHLRWFLRCPKWDKGCRMFLWEDELEPADTMRNVTQSGEKSNVPSTQPMYPPLPPPHDPPNPQQDGLARARPPISPTRVKENSSFKRTADEIEDLSEGESTDLDDVTSESSKCSDAPSDEDIVNIRSTRAGQSRKERRTAFKDRPGKDSTVSFATAATSFPSACTSFVTAPATPRTGHRSRLAFDQDENDIFTSGPLQKAPMNYFYSKLIGANGKPSPGIASAPETPHRPSRYPSLHPPTPTTPGNSRSPAAGAIGLETPSGLSPDIYSFQTELGKISTDLQTRLVGLMCREARKAEGYRRARDITRKLLKENKEENEKLKKRIDELEKEKEMTKQVNENLKSQLESLRINSPSVSEPGSQRQ